MVSITAIEFGGDTCALARTSVSRGEVAVSAAELFNPTAFPGVEAFTAALRKSRLALGLARRGRVVLWGLPDGVSRTHPAVKEVLTPLTDAGFRVERVVSPCNALAALARAKTARGEGATCWVAINRGGVAIVVVRPGTQIYAHSFPWNSTIGASGSQARLLQRYSLVAALAPEVRRAMQEARTNGFPVDAVVTCGNLPDLRSLTMPLIEELDIEVETLDSLDGLIVKPAAIEKLTDTAAAIRLACAGVIARVSRPWDDSKRAAAKRSRLMFRVAAAIALLAGLAAAYLAYERWQRVRIASPATVAPTAQPVPPPARGDARGTRNPPAGPPSISPRTSRESPVTPPARASGKPAAPVAESPARTLGAPRTSIQPATTPPPRKPSASPPERAAAPIVQAPVPLPSSKGPEPSASNPPPFAAPPRQAAPARPLRVLLSDPLPRITAILVSNDRRFATVDSGQVVGIGDVLGRRVVIGIDDRQLILREPSGVRVRVGLGGKFLGADHGSAPAPAM